MRIINLSILKSLSHPSLMSFRYLLSPQFLRSGHFKTSHRGYADARRVWTVYDPVTCRIVAKRGPGDGQNQELESASGGDGQRTYLDDGDRSYGNAKKAQPEERPDFGRGVEGFSAGERAFGGVQNGSSVQRSGMSQSFWACPICGGRVGQQWGRCSGCHRTGKMKWVSGNDKGNDTSELGVSGNRLSSTVRDGTQGSVEKANVVGGSGKKYSKEKKALGGSKESLMHESKNGKSVSCTSELQVSENAVWSSIPKQASEVDALALTMMEEAEFNYAGETQMGILSFGDLVGDLRIDKTRDISEDTMGNKSSGLEVPENAEQSFLPEQVRDVSPLPLTMNQELESASGGEETHNGLSSSSDATNDGSDKKSKDRMCWSTRQTQLQKLPAEHKAESASEEKDKAGLASSSDGMNDLDRDGIEVSIKKASLVDKSANRSGFDKWVKDSSRERASKVLENGFGQGFNVGDVVTKKKKAKSAWICSSCGHTDGQWWGECKVCKCVGTIKPSSVGDSGGSGDETIGFGFSKNSVRSWIHKRPDEELPVRLTDVNRGINKLEWRIPLPGSFGSEVARVLGSGLVPGSLVLVGGDPGVGKSTLLLQIAALIAQGQDSREPGPVVYVSGEESVKQIGNRADRVKIGTKELFLYASTDIEDILGKTHSLSPRLLIVDSIQTVYLKNVTGSAGGISQVKECTAALLRYAKTTNVPVLLIGHVTKAGDIAGPRVLEHIVDVVLYLEGEKCTFHRLLRSVKNRFGSTDEIGIFEMSQLGLQAVLNPSEMFLTEQPLDSELLAGLAVAVIMDGTRTFLIEIQALCSSDLGSSRHFNGLQNGRANMIVSILFKQAGLYLQEMDIFVNVVSGVKLSETAGDLAVAAAICSSFLESPIPSGVAFIGEIGLSGELRAVPRIDARVNTVAKLGYKKCIVPKSSMKSLKGLDHKDLEIIGCSSLKEVLNTVFTTSKNKALT